ncbi:MAG TPA: FeoA family protein [Longimicrobiales bacterium]|nr:FeoA family protein [Longimicrobiales bacterium]
MPMRVLNWLGLGRAWGSSCAAGAPVPTQDFCAALDCDSICLTELGPGETGSVTCLQDPASGPACKLAAMGVLPGVDLRMVQRYPAFVFRIGHAEFAVDEEIARHVRVHRLHLHALGS